MEEAPASNDVHLTFVLRYGTENSVVQLTGGRPGVQGDSTPETREHLFLSHATCPLAAFRPPRAGLGAVGGPDPPVRPYTSACPIRSSSSAPDKAPKPCRWERRGSMRRTRLARCFTPRIGISPTASARR